MGGTLKPSAYGTAYKNPVKYQRETQFAVRRLTETKLQDCHPPAEVLAWSHESSLAIGSESKRSCKLRSAFSMGPPSWAPWLLQFPLLFSHKILWITRGGASSCHNLKWHALCKPIVSLSPDEWRRSRWGGGRWERGFGRRGERENCLVLIINDKILFK